MNRRIILSSSSKKIWRASPHVFNDCGRRYIGDSSPHGTKLERRISQLHYCHKGTPTVFRSKAEFKLFRRGYYSKSSFLLPVLQKTGFVPPSAYIFLMIWTTSSSSSSCSCECTMNQHKEPNSHPVWVWQFGTSFWSKAYLAHSLGLMLDTGTPYQSAAIFTAVSIEGQKQVNSYMTNSQSNIPFKIIQ